MEDKDLIREAMIFAVKDLTGKAFREATIQSMIRDFEKQLNSAIERLPIGTIVQIVDKPEQGRAARQIKTITGYCDYDYKPIGYLCDYEGIFLDDDFERTKHL